jgi:hypothetical protein
VDLPRSANLSSEAFRGVAIRLEPLPGPRLKPGSRLVREWHGRTYMVSVTDEAFEFQGKSYRSLTEIARRLPALNGPGLDSLD